jgi:hypothetical protein
MMMMIMMLMMMLMLMNDDDDGDGDWQAVVLRERFATVIKDVLVGPNDAVSLLHVPPVKVGNSCLLFSLAPEGQRLCASDAH